MDYSKLSPEERKQASYFYRKNAGKIPSVFLPSIYKPRKRFKPKTKALKTRLRRNQGASWPGEA